MNIYVGTYIDKQEDMDCLFEAAGIVEYVLEEYQRQLDPLFFLPVYTDGMVSIVKRDLLLLSFYVADMEPKLMEHAFWFVRSEKASERTGSVYYCTAGTEEKKSKDRAVDTAHGICRKSRHWKNDRG